MLTATKTKALVFNNVNINSGLNNIYSLDFFLNIAVFLIRNITVNNTVSIISFCFCSKCFMLISIIDNILTWDELQSISF